MRTTIGTLQDQISTKRLERALRIIAGIVAAEGGEVYVPIFERLERELADRKRAQDARARARALLASPSSDCADHS